MQADLVDLVSQVVARVLDGMAGEVTPETSLTPEHGVDSLAYLEIIELVEAAATLLAGRPMPIDDVQFPRLCTVADVARYVADSIEGGRVGGSR